jgi:exonuclease SbcC
MINYPRIYSLSTVGVIMHYNQDYLLHPVRTDFTGRNGIGKSLIADLIQLIFVTESNLIVFGTDSVKKKERQVHTLPYNTSDAYVFMNIEFAHDQFVTIGVNIPNKKSRPIRSFWILNRAFNDRDNHDLKDLSIEKSNLVIHRNFIMDGTIPPIDKLAVHFRETKSLYLRYFTDAKQKQEFYSFLYHKELLPINLTIEENRKTFAKIIQSFSKAKSLDTDSDKSLKEFLFESNIDSLEEQYEDNKRELEKLLTDFKELDKYTKEMERKQENLINLRALDEKRIASNQTLLATKIVLTSQEFKTLNKDLGDAQKKLTEDQNETEYLKTKVLPQVERLAKYASATIESTKDINSTLTNYKSIYEEKVKIQKSIDELLKIDLPDISEELQQSANMELFDRKEMARRILKFVSVYEKYGSVAELEAKTLDQKTKISEYRNELAQSIESLQNLKNLISMNKKGTLFAKLFEDGKTLNKNQETVLMALLSSAFWGKPEKVQIQTRFVNDLNVLDEKFIEEDQDNNGYWLKMGGVREFVPKSKDKQLFANADELAWAISNRNTEIENEIKSVDDKISELEQFEKGNTFNTTLIGMKYELDQDLVDHTALSYYKVTLGIIQNLSSETNKWNQQVKTLDDQLVLLKSTIPTVDEQQLPKEIEKYAAIIEANTQRERKLSIHQGKKSERYKALKDSLPNQSGLIKTKEQEKEIIERELKTVTAEYNQYYPDTLPKDHTSTDIQLTELSKQHARDRENYVTEYRSIAREFSNELNKPEVKEQIDKENYNFNVLEVVLLGNKIKHTDAIAHELRESNRGRENLMATIHETMLKIFSKTKKKYEDYDKTIKDLNIFFRTKRISEKYSFRISLKPHPKFKIDWINQLQGSSLRAYKPGELPLGDSVEKFVEDFFQKATGYKQRMQLSSLLDPRTYFEVETKLTDDRGNDKPGSTGESYSAIVLLGIGRLSIVQEEKRKGIKFLILEETANLDRVNFNTFPNIAEEFGYQILTMTPRPYGSDNDQGWYLHHLLEGFDDPNINYPIPNSFFKTNEGKEDLMTYLAATTD